MKNMKGNNTMDETTSSIPTTPSAIIGHVTTKTPTASLHLGGRNDSDGSCSGGEKTRNQNISSDIALPEDVLEKLYQSYAIKQKRAGLGCFLAASVLFDLWAILVPQGQSWESLGVTCVFLVLNLGLALFLRLYGRGRFKGAIWEVAPNLGWLLAIMQLFLQLFFKGSVTARDSLGWAILLNFLVYVTLPVPLKYTGILLGLGSFATYINTIIGLAQRENFFWEQQTANAILLFSAAMVGLLCYFLGEAKQRRAFLEAKQSLEVKMLIEEQSAEQERLLLSVLPEHVAVKMRQDLGSTDSEQFKKIYMSRHENVSILYADIVGFTAISSTYCAQDLVKMLNDLFARFDRLAEKYHQLRIKILGDCYYCISGAPVERPDHAALCVYMGLSMVKAIKYVQQKTHSPVDMRVGIHTGAVLAGILGQRQWQFDVYSKDVELANKMESSGLAGRVHISEKTLSFLNGEFEVEPAYGEKREEALRIAGLKTYFIGKVLKPFVPAPNEYKNGATKSDTQESIEPDGPSEILKDDDCTSPADVDEEANIGSDKKEDDFKMRLRKELVSRDGHGELSKDTNLFLTFKNKDHESAYSCHREPLSSVPLIASLLVHIVGGIYSLLVLPRTLCHFIIILTPLFFLILIVVISVAESFPMVLPSGLIYASKKFNDMVWLRRSAAICTILLVGLPNFFDMIAASTISPVTLNMANATFSERITPSEFCLFPSYFSNYGVLILVAASVVAQLSHICKILLMILIAGLHCFMNIFLMEEQFRNEEYHTWNARLPLRYTLSALLIAVTLALSVLARHMDKEDRVIFMWKIEVTEQKEKASDMRRRNEALVYNVLPVHVAEHFMSNRKRSYDELYSQSYAEVGVLFASMPNFSDFYSEETVNNQGLECLRFLNEVISDFDALLELPQFQDIIKIKTIGSTYMAASGLNPSRQVKPDDPIVVRWAHLALLVEFALELKRALQSINEQSFNHFVLKMGINHGPITAGVIGARKPHYDIWGNTVNVASRMESTGKAGAIQVTEETCQILQTFGYTFEQRGLVAVKGKGQLMTYYLQGKSLQLNKGQLPPISPINTPSMEPVEEVDEPKESPPLLPSVTSDSPIPALTSISSSSASPNSVRINQDYVEKHQLTSSDIMSTMMTTTTTITTTSTNNCNTSNEKSTDHITSSSLSSSTSSNGSTTAYVVAENDVIKSPINKVVAQQTQNISNSISRNNDTASNNSEDDTEIDAKTPLLDNKNSTNVNHANDFCVSEKDALLDNTI